MVVPNTSVDVECASTEVSGLNQEPLLPLDGIPDQAHVETFERNCHSVSYVDCILGHDTKTRAQVATRLASQGSQQTHDRDGPSGTQSYHSEKQGVAGLFPSAGRLVVSLHFGVTKQSESKRRSLASQRSCASCQESCSRTYHLV